MENWQIEDRHFVNEILLCNCSVPMQSDWSSTKERWCVVSLDLKLNRTAWEYLKIFCWTQPASRWANLRPGWQLPDNQTDDFTWISLLCPPRPHALCAVRDLSCLRIAIVVHFRDACRHISIALHPAASWSARPWTFVSLLETSWCYLHCSWPPQQCGHAVTMHVAVASSLGEPSKLIGGQIRCRLINLRSSGAVDKPQNGRAYNWTQFEYKVSHRI